MAKEKKLRKRKQDRIDRITNLELRKPKEEDKSSDNSAADEDANFTESEEEILLPPEDPRKKREEEKYRLYELMMKLKLSQCAQGHYVCPDADCKFTSSKEDKVANHVITQHGKSRFVKKKGKGRYPEDKIGKGGKRKGPRGQ